MMTKKPYTSAIDITEEKIFSKPKCQAILSLIAYYQKNNKKLQRAHLIRALVKNQKQSSDDKNFIEQDIIDQLQMLGTIMPKIMFNSIAHLDQTVQYLRKLGFITNQYLRGYPRIILTDKGLTLFYKYTIKKMIDELIHDGSELMYISNHIFTLFIPKEKHKTMVFTSPEFHF